jgi:hypothetical protein
VPAANLDLLCKVGIGRLEFQRRGRAGEEEREKREKKKKKNKKKKKKKKRILEQNKESNKKY